MTAQSDMRNILLRKMPSHEFLTISGNLEQVDLEYRKTLYRSDERIRSIYFPESGIASIVSILDDGQMIEAGVAGRDGMVGVPVVLGVEAAPTECFVQSPGVGWRIDASVFRAALEHSPGLHGFFLRYVMAYLGQVTQTTACNGVHTVLQRLARWLLVIHDRCEGDRMMLTQETIATCLGVRRAGVTEAAGALQKAGAIAYAKGVITVVDRAALEAMSCECYGAVKRQYDRLGF